MGLRFSIAVFSIVWTFLVLTPAAMADKASSLNNKGIKSFKMRDFDGSSKSFSNALVERPESPELHFNLGTSLSALNQKDQAVEELVKAAQKTKDPELAAAGHFNAGNTLLKSNDFQGAIKEYGEALKYDQRSADIRHNLELAIKKMKEQQQKKGDNNQSSGDNDQGKKNDKNDKQKKDDKDNEKQKDNKQDKSQQNKQNKDEKKDQQDQPSQQDKSEKQQMSKDEALRLLDAVNNDEQKALSLRRAKMKEGLIKGNDW